MYKCVICKTPKDIGDDVYIVEGSYSGFSPTCSIECAEFFKEKQLKDLEERANRIRNYEIKKERW